MLRARISLRVAERLNVQARFAITRRGRRTHPRQWRNGSTAVEFGGAPSFALGNPWAVYGAQRPREMPSILLGLARAWWGQAFS